MEEQQITQPQIPGQPPAQPPAQPPVTTTPVSSKKFPWKKLIVVLVILIIAVGGVGIGLAWKTTYLDRWLPQNIKEMFGKGEIPGEQPGEKPEEKAPYAGKLAFLQEGEVWVISSDGTGKEKLTNTGGKIKVFHFSPDGKSLAYILQKKFADSEGFEEVIGYRLSILDLSTKSERTIVKSLPEERISDFSDVAIDCSGLNDFAFSYDGTKIVYTREGVWVLDLTTEKATQLREDPMTSDKKRQRGRGVAIYYGVEWSPDDKKILSALGYYEGMSWEVFDANGSNVQDVGEAGMGGGNAAEGFIDDNRLLMCGNEMAEFDDEQGEEEVYWISLAKINEENTIVSGRVSFSPVYYSSILGKVLFVTSCTPPCSFQTDQIYSIGLDGEGLTSLLSEPLDGLSFGEREIAISPSGKIGVIRWNYDQDLEEVWVIDPTTKDQRKLTQVVPDDETDETTIEWSPD